MTFWAGRRVLITGHTGFKGGWLSFWLSRLGADVVGFALRPDTDPNLFELLDIAGRVRSQFGDIKDLDLFRKVARTAKPQVFFHLAAQAEVRAGYADPVGTFDTNVMGTANALQVTREMPELQAMVVVTSDKCYQNDDRTAGYEENDPLGGDDPYSASKACAEIVTASFRRSYLQKTDCAVATARAGNVIGGGDWARDRLVPDIVRALVNESPLRLRNPEAIRPWQHVLEPLAGYLRLAERLCTQGAAVAEAWNFGPAPDGSLAVADLAQAICMRWGRQLVWQREEGVRLPESQRLVLDAAKARERLDWEPRLSGDDAVAWTVEWYKSWLRGEHLDEVTANQIERYGGCVRDA